MPRREEALASMRDALQLTDPEWDIVPGTAEYKILEAVAQQIENITFNSVLNDYHFDIDKKTGLELDLFMSLFGFSRIKARRATGAITFSRATTATQDYVIPVGTQIFVPPTQFSPSIFFQTTISAVLTQGSTEVSVPAQAVIAGTTGNVSAGSISGLATAIGGITAVNNPQPFTGGRDAETDTDLKDRWRRTVFRNISGTEDSFLAMAFNESAFVTRANVIGPIERYLEQIQLAAPTDLTVATPWETTVVGNINAGASSFSVTDGDVLSAAPFYAAFFASGEFQEIIYVGAKAADALSSVIRAGTYDPPNGVTIRQVFPSSVPDTEFTFPAGGEVIGLNIGLTTQSVGVPSTDGGTTGDYVLITSTGSNAAPSSFPFLFVTVDGATNFGLDSVVDVEHEYTPLASRNDLSDSADCQTADKVDMFVDGEDPLTVIEQFSMPVHGDIEFGPGGFDEADFLRDDGTTNPTVENLFTRLSKAPIVSVPSSLSLAATSALAATTYYKDEDYWLVADFDDPNGFEGSTRARNGLEWRNPSAAATGTFSASRQGVSGKLNGWYAYVFTFEIDGIESLPSDSEAADDVNVKGTFGKNDLVVPAAAAGVGTRWRRVYRSETAATEAEALLGPFFLHTVIKNNSESLGAGLGSGLRDNKADAALLPIQPPKAPPVAGTLVSVEYNYNRLIERLDAQVDLVRLVGMDTLVHAADDVALKFNLAVVLQSGISATDAEADINTILTAWINRKNFRNNVQIADVVEEVGQSSSVDNVRLVESGEERDEVQQFVITTTADTPDADRDTFKVTIAGQSTGAIPYNEDPGVVREHLEALSNIHEGNTYASQIQEDLDVSETNIIITDTEGFPKVGGSYVFPYYIQIDDEIMKVTSSASQNESGTANLIVVRGALSTTPATHNGTLSPLADIHILGDIAITESVVGTAHTYTVYFLTNGWSQDNNWGSRRLDLITVEAFDDSALIETSVSRRVQGVGSGIQTIAANGLTVITTVYDDFYLDSDELPSMAGVNLLLRAQNTF